jgi:hypothetical protein
VAAQRAERRDQATLLGVAASQRLFLLPSSVVMAP